MTRPLFWAGLVTGLALIVAGSPARAGFSFQLRDNSSKDGLLITENKNGTFSVVDLNPPKKGTKTSYSNLKLTKETGSEIGGSVTVDGVNFRFDVKSNQDTKSSTQGGQVTVAMQVLNPNGVSTNFSYYAADGAFSGAGAGSRLVYSLNTLAGTSSGNRIQGDAVMQGASQRYTTGNTVYEKGAGKSTHLSTGVLPTGQLASYNLSNIGGQILIGGTGGKHLNFAAAVATPEPTGVLLGVLGLPCMAGLVVWARRRRVPVAA